VILYLQTYKKRGVLWFKTLLRYKLLSLQLAIEYNGLLESSSVAIDDIGMTEKETITFIKTV
jgi:hypothetical protein